MRYRTPFLHGFLTPSDTFKQAHPSLQSFVRFHVDEISTGNAMLGNEDWLFAAFKLRQQFGGLALQGGDKFSPHKVIL